MITVIHESRPVARNNYHCDACDFLFEVLFDVLGELSFREKRSIVIARRNNRMITKGERYIRQFNTDGSYAWTFRAIPEIHSICLKFDLYCE